MDGPEQVRIAAFSCFAVPMFRAAPNQFAHALTVRNTALASQPTPN